MRNQRLALLALTAGAVTLAACDDARPIEGREEQGQAATCSVCHGFPPAAPHPQSQACSVCHPQTVDQNANLLPGGAHGNGKLDVTFGHPANYQAVHSSEAVQDLQRCAVCHGADYGGGTSPGAGYGTPPSCNGCHGSFFKSNWQTNCTFCHGIRDASFTLDKLDEAAPPEGVSGGTLPSDPRVGAHAKHLATRGATLSKGFACQTCHPLAGALSHVDGKVPVDFQFLPLASTGGAKPQFTKATQTCSSVYCHGATLQGGTQTSPRWTQTLSCDSCHGQPPPTGQHDFHVNTQGVKCGVCHGGVGDLPFDPAKHVNGVADVVSIVSGQPFTTGWSDCTVCHPR